MASDTPSHNIEARKQPANDDDDIISNLPTHILSHIISFLPMDEAVATSLLSTRWKFIWKDIDTLNLTEDFRLFNNVNEEVFESLFVHFVNKILTSLSGERIYKFNLRMRTLALCESIMETVINWIGTAVSRDAEVIIFCLDNYPPYAYEMPCTLFTSKTLQHLYLSGAVSLKVPKLVSLRNLKTLNLRHAYYICDESCECNRTITCYQSFYNLMSGCSSLESLQVSKFTYLTDSPFIVSSPTVRILCLRIEAEVGHYGKQLEINAPQLRYLKLYDEGSRKISVGNLYLLDEAHIELRSYYFFDPDIYSCYSDSVVKLFQRLHNVTKLSLTGESLTVLSDAGVTPRFPRLVQLNIEAKCCIWDSLLKIVESSNKLEHLTISLDHYVCHSPTRCWSKPEKVPLRFFSCLEKMSINKFTGLADELEMVAYVLENAKLLTTMTIKLYGSRTKKYKMVTNISYFCRGSAKCQIIFS